MRIVDTKLLRFQTSEAALLDLFDARRIRESSPTPSRRRVDGSGVITINSCLAGVPFASVPFGPAVSERISKPEVSRCDGAVVM